MLREAAFEASATLGCFAPHQSRSAFLLSFVAEEKDGSRANMACSHVLPTRAAIVRRPKASSLEERKRFSGLSAVLYVLSWTRSEEHTSELHSLMRISYAVFCLKQKKQLY